MRLTRAGEMVRLLGSLKWNDTTMTRTQRNLRFLTVQRELPGPYRPRETSRESGVSFRWGWHGGRTRLS